MDTICDAIFAGVAPQFNSEREDKKNGMHAYYFVISKGMK